MKTWLKKALAELGATVLLVVILTAVIIAVATICLYAAGNFVLYAFSIDYDFTWQQAMAIVFVVQVLRALFSKKEKA